MNPQIKKIVQFLIRLIFVGGLLTLLVRKGLLSISLQETGKALTNWAFILPTLMISILSTLVGVVRWVILLRAQDIRIATVKIFELSMVGTFFNIALPGAVSGDLVKAFYVGREAKGARAKAFGSILFDRIIGLAAMVIASASALLVGYDHFRGSPLLGAVRVFLVTLAASFLVFFAYLLLLNEKRDPALSLLKAFSRRISAFGSILRIYEGIRTYHKRRGTVAAALGLSLFIQILSGLSTLQLCGALGENSISLLALYVVIPLGLLTTAIPVLPGGVGTGHVAFGYLFSLLGSQRGADLFTLLLLYNLLVGAVGGLFYLRFKSSPDFEAISAHASP